MLSISAASNAEDYAIAAALARALGEWDAGEAPAYGISPEMVLELFHSDDDEDVAAKYSEPDQKIFIARWDGEPAGCVAFERHSEDSLELHKFFVDARFRGKGVGRALMDTALGEAGKSGRKTIVLHTTRYMKSAVALYESFGFRRCPPFRQVPAAIEHTEVFMTRPL
jgi:GNAT superfamily N-acetyltransferase